MKIFNEIIFKDNSFNQLELFTTSWYILAHTIHFIISLHTSNFTCSIEINITRIFYRKGRLWTIQNLLGIDYVYFFRQRWRVNRFPAKLILKLKISQTFSKAAF